jgi:hypothetical protein
VTGDQRTEYSLLMTRNVGFNLEKNDDMDTAQSLGPQIAGRRWMIGHLNDVSDKSDFYAMQVQHPIDIETFTPAGAEGEFVNLLDPMIRVYDIHGNLLAEDDNSNDGLNAALQFQPTGEDSDVFFIEVLSVVTNGVGGAGEYVLSVRGAEPVEVDALPAGAAEQFISAELAAALDAVRLASVAVDQSKPSTTTATSESTTESQLAASAVDWLMAATSLPVSFAPRSDSDSALTADSQHADADSQADDRAADLLWDESLAGGDPLV